MKKLTNIRISVRSPFRRSTKASGFRYPASGSSPRCNYSCSCISSRIESSEYSKNKMLEPEAGSREPEALTLRNYRHPIQQKLRPGNNHLIPGLDAVLHFVVVAHRLPNFQRLLPGHE